jgi:nucleotide-binding universal stress UspA family protein
MLVPIDFSQHARTALEHARELAALYNARLDLLHVIEDTLHPAFYHIEVSSIYDAHPAIEDTSFSELKAFFEGTKGPEVEAAFHVTGGDPAQEIVAFAETHKSDWVVLATHGLRGLDHFLMGSVAEKVVQRAPVPVFTVKSFGKRLLAAQALEKTQATEKA